MSFKVKRIIDLSQPIFNNCPGNPAFPACKVKQIMSYDKEGWRAEIIEIATHISSHIDTPAHHLPNKGGRTYAIER